MRRVGLGWCAVALCWGMAHALAAAAPSTTSQAQPVQPHMPPPTGTIVINGGATHTNVVAVALDLSASSTHSTVTQMKFSNDNVSYSAPEPFATTKNWTLAGADGEQPVYVKFQDAVGLWSPPISDTIILDTIPPAVQITDPTDGQLFGAP